MSQMDTQRVDKKTAVRFFRMVCAPEDMDRVAALLRAEGFDFAAEGISPWAFRLLAEPRALGTSLAAFFGLIYIQDRSSMLPPLVLNPPSGAVALDMCASPGSKTGLLAQLVGPRGLVVGNEPNPVRLGTLRRNLEVANLAQTVTSRGAGEELKLADGAWPYVLLDPPCSGWGTVERHPKVLKLWKGDKIKPLVNMQRDLLRRAAQLLRPGGRLVYSTCTTNSAENEDQIAWACERLGLQAQAFAAPGADPDTLVTGLSIAGGEGEGQGFFVALLGKEDEGAFGVAPDQNGLAAQRIAERQEAWWGGWREHLLARDVLDSACFDATRLPPGEVAAFGENLIFMPAPAAGLLPPELSWRGFALGKCSAGLARPSPRLRLLMRSAKDCPALDVDEPETIRRLLSGNSLSLDAAGREAGLYFQGLALGLLRLRGGRAMWSEG